MIRTIFLSLFLTCFATAAQADCFNRAAEYQHVNSFVLKGITQVESSFNEKAKHVNHNQSIDYGYTQVNSVHLPELKQYGITANDLMKGCKNIFVGAFYLRKAMLKYGNTWWAVGGYHVGTITDDNLQEAQDYIEKVKSAVNRLIALQVQ